VASCTNTSQSMASGAILPASQVSPQITTFDM
jgi:hypothetical protein